MMTLDKLLRYWGEERERLREEWPNLSLDEIDKLIEANMQEGSDTMYERITQAPEWI